MQGIANDAAVSLITIYQRFISPRKGFCCAHSAYHGRSSCSSWGIRVIEKHGIGMFFPLMKRRFKACQMAFEKMQEERRDTNDGHEVSDCPCLTKDSAAYCIAGAAPCYWS